MTSDLTADLARLFPPDHCGSVVLLEDEWLNCGRHGTETEQ